MNLSLRSPLTHLGITVIVVFFTASIVIAAPTSKIVGVTTTSTRLYANILTGLTVMKVEMMGANANSKKVLIGENASALLYEIAGTVDGGYEGESAAVKRYKVGGSSNVLLNEPLNLDRIREYRSRKGLTAYVISMSDGGAGIPYVYVCSTSGKVWNKRAARVAGARNGTLILQQYVESEEAGYEDAQPTGNVYLDLDTLLNEK